MKALTWHGRRDVRVDNVPDPAIEKPTDMIIRLTTTNICGSDLHLYEVLTPFMSSGDILGHEPMGVVAEVGRAEHVRLDLAALHVLQEALERDLRRSFGGVDRDARPFL